MHEATKEDQADLLTRRNSWAALQHESWQPYQKHMFKKSVTALCQYVHTVASNADLNYPQKQF